MPFFAPQPPRLSSFWCSASRLRWYVRPSCCFSRALSFARAGSGWRHRDGWVELLYLCSISFPSLQSEECTLQGCGSYGAGTLASFAAPSVHVCCSSSAQAENPDTCRASYPWTWNSYCKLNELFRFIFLSVFFRFIFSSSSGSGSLLPTQNRAGTSHRPFG